MGWENADKVITLDDKRRPKAVTTSRLRETHRVRDHLLLMREAADADVLPIQELYHQIYEGKYAVEFAVNPTLLRAQIADTRGHLWIVAEEPKQKKIVGAIVFNFDRANRLAKAAGVVVAGGYRGRGLASHLLNLGVDYLTKQTKAVDVVYATTRTVNEAPSRVVAEAGFLQMGLFPNAVQVENLEHLNLDVYLTDKGLSSRRRKPYLFPVFHEVYNIARQQLKLERPYLVTERAPLKLSPQKIVFQLIENEAEAQQRFTQLSNERRLSNSFFPFHRPNRILTTKDGGTEVFVCFGGVGKQSAIVGYRTDRVNVHDVLDSVALALQKAGAAYVELLVDAYNYMLQQEAYTARFIPSAYFPAMKLNHDGLRDDLFVVSRTFHLLDFTGSVLHGANLKFLRAYLRYYHELYIKPILGPSI